MTHVIIAVDQIKRLKLGQSAFVQKFLEVTEQSHMKSTLTTCQWTVQFCHL